jgi:hypothetical protein
MVLLDYDAAPDGDGTYVVLDMKFSSVERAFSYRAQMWCGDLYWGHIEDAEGKTIKTLRTRCEEEALDRQNPDDEYDWWAEHTAKCDGCYQCDPHAYPDEGD